jgi:outer membrane lipoprotein SlyB
MPVGYWGGMKARPTNTLQSTAADKPENYLSPEARKYMGYGNAALGGVAAGGQVQPTTDSQDASLQVLGAGIGGAAAGAAAGGPYGALIGGVAGLVSGGLNAYVGTHSARKEQRKQEKLRQEIMAKDEARYQQARADQQKYFDIERSDNQEAARYNRRMAAVQSQWQAQEAARRALNDAITQDQSLKQYLTQEVR